MIFNFHHYPLLSSKKEIATYSSIIHSKSIRCNNFYKYHIFRTIAQKSYKNIVYNAISRVPSLIYVLKGQKSFTFFTKKYNYFFIFHLLLTYCDMYYIIKTTMDRGAEAMMFSVVGRL